MQGASDLFGKSGKAAKKQQVKEAIEAQIRTLEAEKLSLSNQVSALTSELGPLRQQLSDVRQSFSSLAEENARLSSQHAEEIEAKNSALIVVEQKLQQVIESATALGENPELHKDLARLRAEIIGKSEESLEMQLEIGQLKSKIERLELIVLQSEVERTHEELGANNIVQLQRELEQLRAQLEEKNVALTEAALTISRYENQAAAIEKKPLSQDAVAALSENAQLKATNERYLSANNKLKADKSVLEKKCAELESERTPAFPAGLFANMKSRQKQAGAAIKNLESELSASAGQAPTANDIAIKAIVKHLKAGLDHANPQAYFDGCKEDLKTQLNALRGIYSMMNTALNAILTVLAVASVVGIHALWLTETWQNNAKKNGSVFAFSMFGAEQKAKCDIYEATQAMGVTLGA